MVEASQELFEAVRAACSAADWSRGVELTRAGAVVAESLGEDEALFRVARSGRMLSRKVMLFPDDVDWECECASHESACKHVAAAVIAWRRSAESGEALPAAGEESGRVRYRFSRDEGKLALARVLVVGDREHPLRSTLAALAAGRVEGPPFVAAQEDLAVELALGTHRHGVLSRALVLPLFRRLAHCSDIQLDGREVDVSGEIVVPRACLVDQGAGFRLSVEPDPSIRETFANGIVLCGDTLQPAGEAHLTGRERHELLGGRYFGADDATELVTEILPALRRRIPVVVQTERLPQAVVEIPRIEVETRADGETLSVLASLVYGDPPRARVVGGKLVLAGGAVPLRDTTAEKRLIGRLKRELGLEPGVLTPYAAEEAVTFTARLDRWNGDLRSRDHESFRVAAPLEPRLHLSGLRFDLEFESPVARGGEGRGGGTADPERVLQAWRQGRSLVPLLEGGWAPVPADWLQRFGHRVADLLAARHADGELPRCSLPDLAGLCEELQQPPPPELAGLETLARGFEAIPQAPVPSDVVAELRSYQARGVDWLVFLREAGLGGLLADDMGLGKTLQALCAIRGRTLVVAPTSVLHNWADEIRKFRPGLTYSIYHGPGRTLDRSATVTLTTYAILRLDADRLVGEEWDTVVLDEAQAIKNPQSQVAAAAHRLKAGFRVTLTGTPVENRLEELWSQFHFINRGLLGGRDDFHERYADPIADGEAGAAERLRERIRPFLLRRLKQEVAPELPPRTEIVLRCELGEAERAIYDAIRVATLDEVVSRLQAGGSVLAALEALLRLRQAACHPSLVPGQQAEGSSKIALLLETLDNVVAEGHKALVFSQWTSLLDLTEPALKAAGIDYVRLDGSTRDRGAVVRRFQDDAELPVMLISLKAGGTGLNLTAADHVFLLDPWWNPAVEDQAADRAHRIGQERPVMIYRLVAERTVEERILDLQTKKRALADAALQQTHQATQITRKDLLALLE